MGDRYILTIKCSKCEKIHDDVWYAPTSGFLTFTCSCGEVIDLEKVSGINAESTAKTPSGIEAIKQFREGEVL